MCDNCKVQDVCKYADAVRAINVDVGRDIRHMITVEVKCTKCIPINEPGIDIPMFMQKRGADN